MMKFQLCLSSLLFLSATHGFVPTLPWTTSSSARTALETSTVSNNNVKHEVEEEEEDLHWFRFGGVARLYSDGSTQQEEIVLDRFQSATVAVVGLGGIGSWAAESLGRSGIGRIVLVDLDDLCISSTNRQLHALATNCGEMKTQVLKERLVAMNPTVQVEIIEDFVMEDTVDQIVAKMSSLQVKAVVDAMDGPDEKAMLWMACARQQIPVFSCGSAAGRPDPTKVVCSPDPPQGDVLLEATIRAVDKHNNEDQGSATSHVQWVYAPADFQEEALEEGSCSFRTEGPLGTASFVSGTMGLAAAAKIVEGIARQTL